MTTKAGLRQVFDKCTRAGWDIDSGLRALEPRFDEDDEDGDPLDEQEAQLYAALVVLAQQLNGVAALLKALDREDVAT